MILTRETFTGPWAGLPVAWTDDDQVDEDAYRSDVADCCEAGVPGIYTGGTTGEFYAMEFDEFQQVTHATIEECHAHNTPAMIGCSSTYTLGAMRRAEFAADLQADAIQVAVPYWMPIADDQIVPFFQSVSAAAGGLPLSVYETTRAKRALTLEQHRAIHQAMPNYWMVKSNADTIGATAEGCEALADLVNVFVGEHLWTQLGPSGIRGSCSSLVYWNPPFILELWSSVEQGDWKSVEEMSCKLSALHQFLHQQFEARGFTDTAYDRLGGVASGFLNTSLRSRGPYPSATNQDVEIVRRWYEQHFPEMLNTHSHAYEPLR